MSVNIMAAILRCFDIVMLGSLFSSRPLHFMLALPSAKVEDKSLLVLNRILGCRKLHLDALLPFGQDDQAHPYHPPSIEDKGDFLQKGKITKANFSFKDEKYNDA